MKIGIDIGGSHIGIGLVENNGNIVFEKETFIKDKTDIENKIEKYITKWNIREEEYQKIILTDVMEIYIIELPKFEKYKEKTDKVLNSWVKFIENPEVVKMDENEEVKKAQKELEKISGDEHERYLSELREKYILDQKATEDAGYYKGIKAVAKKLLQKKISIEIISQTTGLTKEEIEKL